MKSNSLEQQIKSQIDEGKIQPSRDLWKDIENEMQKEPKKKSFALQPWYAIAASIVLLISLGIVFFNFNQTEETPAKNSDLIVNKDTPTNNSEIISTDSVNNVDIPKIQIQIQEQNEILNTNNVQQKGKIAIEESKIKIKEEVQPNLPIPKTENNVPQKLIDNTPKIAQQTIENIQNDIEVSKTTPKTKSFVDPKTLLFSVEHKDVIKSTKKSTNLAVIDLE